MTSDFAIPDPEEEREVHVGSIVAAGLGWGLFVCVHCGCVIRLQSVNRRCSWPYLYAGSTTAAWPPQRLETVEMRSP